LRGQTKPGLVAFYDVRPGNGAGLFFLLIRKRRLRWFGHAELKDDAD